MAVNDELTHMTVFPEQSEIRDVAKLLLALADSPRDVTTTLDPTVGFRIPVWLYDTFTQVWEPIHAAIKAGVEVNLSEVKFSDKPISDEFIAELRADATPDQQAQLDLFQKSLKLSAEAVAALGDTGTEVIEPVKRKPGRPRKEVK